LESVRAVSRGGGDHPGALDPAERALPVAEVLREPDPRS
jgi:hypothetical protein